MCGVMTTAGGMSLAPGNDVCKTPPLAIPIPYTNIANNNEFIPNHPRYKTKGGDTCTADTMAPVSHSDEPGSQGGVASGTVAAICMHPGNNCSRFFCESGPVSRVTSISSQNTNNTSGTQIVNPNLANYLATC